MSEAQVASAPAAPLAEPPQPKPAEAVRLRAPSPRIVRLSPKVLIGLSATSAAAVFGLVLFALHMHGPHAPATNLVDAARPNPAEAVKSAPADYAAVHQGAAATGSGTPGAGCGGHCCRGFACGRAEARAGAAGRSWPPHPERPGAGLGSHRSAASRSRPRRRPSGPRWIRCARSSLRSASPP